jgi:hypothetical protein
VDEGDEFSIENTLPDPDGILIRLGMLPDVNLNQTHTVTCDLPLKKVLPLGTVTLSSTPSNTMDPKLAELKVGPLVSVPLLLNPLLSNQAVPDPG